MCVYNTVLALHIDTTALSDGTYELIPESEEGDQAVDSAHQLIKLPIDVGALVINKFLKLILGDAFIEVRRQLPSFFLTLSWLEDSKRQHQGIIPIN